MIISQTIVKNPRTKNYCSACGEPLPVGARRARLFGYADRGDTPYVVAVHLSAECMGPEAWSCWTPEQLAEIATMSAEARAEIEREG